MTGRALALTVLGAAAILAATYGLPGERPVGPKLSREECRHIAAKFLGLAPAELSGDERAIAREAPSDTHPPLYAFVLPYPQGPQVTEVQRYEGRAVVEVDASTGEVRFAEFAARKYEIAGAEVGEERAKSMATAYLQRHWPHFPQARLLTASKPWRPGRLIKPPRAPQQHFCWVVEKNGIRLGRAEVTVNLSTSEVVSFSQTYYSAEGVRPAGVTREQAIREALARAPAKERGQAPIKDAYLATRWYKGQIGLVWCVWLSVPSGMPARPGERPDMREYGVTLDACTGEVLSEVKSQ